MTETKKNQQAKQQKYNIEQRQALSNAYAKLEADRFTEGVQSFTFEEAATRQLENIVSKGSKLRLSLRGRAERIKNELDSAIETIKQIDLEQLTDNK